MPYPRAYLWVLFVIGVILVGFWPSYFADLPAAPSAFHFHGAAASVWVLMVAAQSWTVHHQKIELHRATGRASLYLFPFLIMGLFAIIDFTAKSLAGANSGLAQQLYGTHFLIGMAIAATAYVVLYYRALKFRRQVWIHAGYMLGTPLILFESPFSRIMSMFVPGFQIRGPEDLDLIIPSIVWADALALAFCLIVYFRFREKAAPFLVTAFFIGLQMVGMGMLGNLPGLREGLASLGTLPSAVVLGLGFAIGAATSWLGWQAGKRPVGKAKNAKPAAA